MANLFSYDGHVFTGWNTRSDGNGKAYSNGDSISSGTTLYAQWSANHFTGIGTFISGFMSFSINLESSGKTLASGGYIDSSTVYSNSDTMLISISGSSDWSASDGGLTFTYGSHTYLMTLTVSNATSHSYEVKNDSGALSFEGSGEQYLTVSINPSR